MPHEECTGTIRLWNGSDAALSVNQAPIETASDPVFDAGGATSAPMARKLAQIRPLLGGRRLRDVSE